MKVLDNLKDTKVLVIGDVMLDRYWWGDVTRISPEAPVPVVRLRGSTLAAGGAANVAANIAGLGSIPFLVGCVGQDPEADLFPQVLRTAGLGAEHLIKVAGRPTTVKTRIIAHSQQVTRVDQESSEPLGSEESARVLDRALKLLEEVDAVAISDYAKGVLSTSVLFEVIAAARRLQKPVIVDPKGRDYSRYRGASLLTPNRREAAEACNIEDNGKAVVSLAGTKLLKAIGVDSVLITEGEEGMTLFRHGNQQVHFPTMARDVYDVTGAGDTVIGVLSAALGAGADLVEAAGLANVAAGLVVEQVGTTAVRLDDLREAIQTDPRSHEQRA